MNTPRPVEFPEFTNTQINVALVADKLNEVIKFLGEKYPEPKPENAFSLSGGPPGLKPGVCLTKNGKYYIPGKGFIKAAEAFL